MENKIRLAFLMESSWSTSSASSFILTNGSTYWIIYEYVKLRVENTEIWLFAFLRITGWKWNFNNYNLSKYLDLLKMYCITSMLKTKKLIHWYLYNHGIWKHIKSVPIFLHDINFLFFLVNIWLNIPSKQKLIYIQNFLGFTSAIAKQNRI